jgi:hypothetical protein
MAEQENPEEKITVTGKRPFLLTLLCLFAFVFYGITTLLFTVASLWSGTIADTVFQYAPEKSFSAFSVYAYLFAGLFFHAAGLYGTILIWRLKKKGFLFFGIASLIIAVYHLFATQISPLTTLFYIIFILLFGLFYRKFR